MSNSKLVAYTKLSPNHSGKRTMKIDRITPHCVVGQCSIETLGNIFAPVSRQASSNYGIGVDGRVGMYVPENMRSWCSSSNANDQRAVTIECASDTFAPYAMNGNVYKTLVNLCVDICKRNGKNKLLWLGNKEKTLSYKPASNEMVLTVHRWFANKSCPGDWLYSRLGELAETVTKQLNSNLKPEPNKILYRVQVGAYSKKENAVNMAAKLKNAGFSTYMVQMGGYYKVQVGAYSKKENAVNMAAKLKNAGFDTYITTEQGNPVTNTEPVNNSLSVGDMVKMSRNAPVYGSSKKFANWVYSSILYVREIAGNRIVISTQKTGAITGAVDIKYLRKI